MELNDAWFSIEGDMEEKPFLIRVRDGLQPFIETKLYTHRLEVAYNYDAEDESLLPEEDDRALMDKVEDALSYALERDQQSVLAFVYTGFNQRVWYWYTKSHEEAGNRINEALATFDELPLELEAEEDPDWMEYRDLTAEPDEDED
jgi:hypothetical protein